eukprot:5904834-Pyramimonas_sp.AAC.1
MAGWARFASSPLAHASGATRSLCAPLTGLRAYADHRGIFAWLPAYSACTCTRRWSAPDSP